MPKRTLVMLSALAIALAGGTAAFLMRSSDGAAPTASASRRPRCRALPAATEIPSWFPKSLTFPEGTLPTDLARTIPKGPSYEQAVFAAHAPLEELVTYVTDTWPKAGWVFGRGERERGEVEAAFSRDDAVGAFRARSDFCDETWTLVYIYVGSRDAVTPSIGPSPAPTQ